MPIYEYVCRSCGAELEKIQRFSDAPLHDCPECGESALTKKVSAPGFRLKGSGWYVTDFRDKKGASNGSDGGSGSGKSTGESKDKAGSEKKSGESGMAGEKKTQGNSQTGKAKDTKQAGAGG